LTWIKTGSIDTGWIKAGWSNAERWKAPLANSMRYAGLLMAVLAAVTGFTPSAQAQTGIVETYSATATIPIGTTRQFTAYVSLSPNTVVWSVNDIPGGNSAIGTIDSAGMYTAPQVVPVANIVKVKATSTAYPTKFGVSTVTISQPTPWIWGVSPSTIPAGAFTISLNGAGYVPGSIVRFAGVDLPTTYISSTALTATGTATIAQKGTVAVTVWNPDPGGVLSQAKNVTVTDPLPPVTVTLSPTSVTVATTKTQQFSATVTGNTNKSVTWSVNGVTGGNSTVGTIATSGLYTAPAAVPGAAVQVKATSVAQPSSFATATVTVAPPILVSVSPTTATVQTSKTQQFTATVTGNANTAVTWSVNGVTGGNATVGTISAAGLYTAPGTAPSAAVQVRATSVVQTGSYGAATVTIPATPAPPAPSTINLSHGRFLEQAAFGPTPTDLANVAQLGFDGWINSQYAMAETNIPVPSDMGVALADYQWRLAQAPDQLRQKVAYELGQIIVISANKNIYPPELVPYLQILSRNAFGNYRGLLKEITTSPQMGKYLDLANSNKAGMSGGANENYAREVMQLFSIGLWQLNPDGSQKLDVNGNPIPTYNQTTVQQVAKALTGWTYPTAAGATPQTNNWENFTGPMEVREGNHDTSAKSFLGCNLPAGQTVMQDTDATLDCLFNNPNVGPFLATRLIRSMVTSNPTPGYIQRVAAAFDNNGAGVRGDMKAVIKAILLDAEARQDAATINQGRLTEPLYFITRFVRGMGGQISATNSYAYVYDAMGQRPLTAPSVFSFFSPMYRIPKGGGLFGPEFQIYTPTESVLRANMAYGILTGQFGSDATVDLTPFKAVAGDISALLDLVNSRMLYGRMPAQMRQSLFTAMSAAYDNNQRVMMAVYLTALSGQYAVQF
jgi:uncharacterized protein (DUF1800 family)